MQRGGCVYLYEDLMSESGMEDTKQRNRYSKRDENKLNLSV